MTDERALMLAAGLTTKHRETLREFLRAPSRGELGNSGRALYALGRQKQWEAVKRRTRNIDAAWKMLRQGAMDSAVGMCAIERERNYLPNHRMRVYDREKAALLATLCAAGCLDIARQFLAEWFGPPCTSPSHPPMRGIEGFIVNAAGIALGMETTNPQFRKDESALLWVGLAWRGNAAEFLLACRELLQLRTRQDQTGASFATLDRLYPVESHIPIDLLMLCRLRNEPGLPPAIQAHRALAHPAAALCTPRPPHPGRWALFLKAESEINDKKHPYEINKK